MKVLNRIKSIYLLAIVALLSFCMLLFPAMPKTASAEGTMGTGTIEIKAAKVVVQEYAQGVEKWAIMFKAEIAKDQYEAIVGTEEIANVRFGMLIGPTAKLGDATTYDALVANKFKPISYVGSVAGEGIQAIEFEEGKTTYEYWGSIVFDDAQLAPNEKPDNRIRAAEMDLTAIPFYGVGTVATKDLTNETATVNYTAEDGFVGSKSATPRNILVESHLRQLDGAEVEDGKLINPETTVKNYAGEIEFFDGDAYICRSTNRLMVGEKQGVLTPANIVADNSTTKIAIAGKAVEATGGAEGTADLIDANYVAGLEKYGKANVVVYDVNGIKAYKADVAERVITRFADASLEGATYDTETDKFVFAEEYDGTADYFATATYNPDSTDYKYTYTGVMQFKHGSSPNFRAVNNAGTSNRVNATTVNVGYFYHTPGAYVYSGLYVLGNNITIPTSNLFKIDLAASSYMNNKAYNTSGEYMKGSITPPILGLGFNGTLDGRGFNIDVKGNAIQGVLPNAFDATIKNVAFLGLAQTYDGGGIVPNARVTHFENVYAQVSYVEDFRGDLNTGILMNVQDCSFKNFVAKVDGLVEAEMKKTLPEVNNLYGSGYGQGMSTSGVFAFKTYMDAYYDANINAIRMTDNNTLSQTPWADNISIEMMKKYFPNVVHENGSFTSSWLQAGRTNMHNPNAISYVSYRYKPSIGTVFTGTSGENVYAVGSSPLYIAYQYSADAASGASLTVNNTALRTTVFVNEALKQTEAAGGATTSVAVNTTSFKWYKMNTLDSDLFAFDSEDGVYSIGEIILRGKLRRHGETRMSSVLTEGTAPESLLEVRLVTMDGWYDVANEEAMAPYVLAQETPFDANFWNVTEDGIVTWAKLA